MTSSPHVAEASLLEDDMLIESARRGDVSAYEMLVARYQDLAFRSAFLVTREVGAAEDAAQEAFLRAYRALPRFRAGSPFRPWLLRIVGNEARRRQAGNIRQHNVALQLTANAGIPPLRSVESEVLNGELRQQLSEAIESLPQMDQLVIAYRFVLELSESEMAAALSCRPGTIKSRLSRALVRLKSRLAVQEPELMMGAADA